MSDLVFLFLYVLLVGNLVSSVLYEWKSRREEVWMRAYEARLWFCTPYANEVMELIDTRLEKGVKGGPDAAAMTDWLELQCGG